MANFVADMVADNLAMATINRHLAAVVQTTPLTAVQQGILDARGAVCARVTHLHLA